MGLRCSNSSTASLVSSFTSLFFTFLTPKQKVKKVKKSEVKEETKEAVDEFEHLKPSVYDTLPFQLYELCKQSPELIEYAKGYWAERQLRKEEEAAAEE